MNNRLLLIGGLILLVVLGVAGFMLLSNNSTNQTQETSLPAQEQVQEDTSVSETPAEEEAEVTNVTLSSSGFSPKSITIKKGAKVVWTNESGAEATVDSNPHPIHTSYPEMNLGDFAEGETLEFTFNETGTYNYHNHLNASQGGSITVEE